MATYSADQIIGKSLIAKEQTNLKRLPSSSASTIHKVPSGGHIGIVQSWVFENGEGSPLWWLFYDSKGRAYYAKHKEGAFDVKALKDQGALSVKEQEEKAKKEKEKEERYIPGNPFEGATKGLSNSVTTGIIIVAAAIAAKITLFK
jgi:hypothetical protein